jgi:hypothetical protein
MWTFGTAPWSSARGEPPQPRTQERTRGWAGYCQWAGAGYGYEETARMNSLHVPIPGLKCVGSQCANRKLCVEMLYLGNVWQASLCRVCAQWERPSEQKSSDRGVFPGFQAGLRLEPL